jgi:hypothetical protein
MTNADHYVRRERGEGVDVMNRENPRLAERP